MQAYLVNIVTLLYLARMDIINPSLVYDKVGNILASMNLSALGCVPSCSLRKII
jgi:hypothetical protein